MLLERQKLFATEGQAGATGCRHLLDSGQEEPAEVYLDLLTLGLQKSLEVGTLLLFLWQKVRQWST